MKIPENKVKEIEAFIGSDESVVGIDARKTHILIIHMLEQIQDQINKLENRLDDIERKSGN